MMYATHLNNGHCLGPCNYSNDKATHLKLCNFSSKVVCSCFLRRYSSWHHNPLNIWIKIQFCQFALILFSILLFFIFFQFRATHVWHLFWLKTVPIGGFHICNDVHLKCDYLWIASFRMIWCDASKYTIQSYTIDWISGFLWLESVWNIWEENMHSCE